MLNFLANGKSVTCEGSSRRDFLRVGSLGFGALTLADVLRARAEAGATGPIGDMIDDLRERGVAAIAPNGVLGDPTGASAHEGDVILDAWVAEVVAMLRT